MSYSNLTDHFSLPYMKSGDVLTEEGESLQWKVVDNLLYAFAMGLTNMILREGSYSVTQDIDDNYHLTIEPLSGVSFAGVINKRLCLSNETKTSTSLSIGAINYVYATYQFSVDLEPSTFTLVPSIETSSSITKLLVATIDMTGESPIIDTTTEKTYSTSISSHMNNNINPHGTVLKQSVIECNQGDFVEMDTEELTIKNLSIYPSIYTTLVSAGSTGVTWSEAGMTPKFATVYGEESVGEIYWSISGSVLTIKNTGATGVTMNVKIEIEESV